MNSNKIEERIKNLDPIAHKFLIDAIKRQYGHERINIVNPKPGDGVSADLILEMMTKVMDTLNNKYIEGGFEYIDKFYNGLSVKIDTAEDELNIKAKAYCEKKVDFEEFRTALKNWYLLNLKAIEIQRNTFLKKD